MLTFASIIGQDDGDWVDVCKHARASLFHKGAKKQQKATLRRKKRSYILRLWCNLCTHARRLNISCSAISLFLGAEPLELQGQFEGRFTKRVLLWNTGWVIISTVLLQQQRCALVNSAKWFNKVCWKHQPSNFFVVFLDGLLFNSKFLEQWALAFVSSLQIYVTVCSRLLFSLWTPVSVKTELWKIVFLSHRSQSTWWITLTKCKINVPRCTVSYVF